MVFKAIRGLRVAGAESYCGSAVGTCVVLALLATGCAGNKVTRIADEDAFQKIVINSDKPVLVDFYKGGCATCIPLDGVMDQLVEEYRGRAVVAKFETMTAFFDVPSREIKHRYDIVFFPTAILFVNGQEKKRWIIRYSIDGYRKVLDEYVPPAPSAIPDAGDDISAK
jgi:thioredoxin 1